MPMTLRIKDVAISLAICVAFLLSFRVVKAFDDVSCIPHYQDKTTDGHAMRLILHCEPGFASSRDRVVVYAMGAPLSMEEHWQESVDFLNEVWIYDVGADGDANLLIAFKNEGGLAVAELYDDQNGDGQVSYQLTNGVPVATEAPYWTVRVVAPEGWWIKGDMVNYNVEVEVDGRVDAVWGARRYLERLDTDSVLDFSISVYDSDGDGSPDRELRQAYPPEDVWYVAHSWLGVATTPKLPPTKGFIFWPYVGAGNYDFFQRPNMFYAPIQVDWNGSRIQTIKEFIPAHESDEVWYVQSFDRFGPGSDPYANFENPVCWLDLAADRDGLPELHIRGEYYGEQDERHWWFTQPSSLMHIRYSWDQDNDMSWDYKLDLLGQHRVSTIVQFPEFKVQTIPCNEFPPWVAEREWGIAVFIATDERNFGEGIYDWGTVRHDLERFVLGLSIDSQPFADLSVGYRGEYNLQFGTRPYLYLSSVDRALHLRDASEALWKLSETQFIEYQDLNDDGYFDSWVYLENGVPLRSLYLVTNHAILVDSILNKVTLTPFVHNPWLFETLPPGNHREWDQLSRRLEESGADLQPADFVGMVSRYGPPTVEIQGASMRDLRWIDTGFRFVLQLDSGFAVASEPDWWRRELIEPGEFLISYSDVFSIRPVTLPRLTFYESDLILIPSAVNELSPVQITVPLLNQGVDDAHSVEITASFTKIEDGAKDAVLASVPLVPGEGKQRLDFSWAPPSAGQWRVNIQARLHDQSGSISDVRAETSFVIQVDPVESPTWRRLLSLPGEASAVSLITLSLLAAVSLTAVGAFLHFLKFLPAAVANRDETGQYPS